MGRPLRLPLAPLANQLSDFLPASTNPSTASRPDELIRPRPSATSPPSRPWAVPSAPPDLHPRPLPQAASQLAAFNLVWFLHSDSSSSRHKKIVLSYQMLRAGSRYFLRSTGHSRHRPAVLFEDLFWTTLNRFREQQRIGARKTKFRFRNRLLSPAGRPIPLLRRPRQAMALSNISSHPFLLKIAIAWLISSVASMECVKCNGGIITIRRTCGI
jgi:hypothetical protein